MRLLLITYYFPPCGGAPVQRWLKWLPDLVAKGFEVTVLTTLGGDYPARDESLLKEIPPEVEVLRVWVPSMKKVWKALSGSQKSLPHGDLSTTKKDSVLHRFIIWARLNLIIPDMRRIWNPRAYRAAIAHLREKPADVVITTGPPHSTHLIGLKLKKRFNIKWVADWRDPWTGIYYFKLNPPGALSMRLHKLLEKKVALNSDLNVTVSKHLAEQLPGENNRAVYNGFDARKFSGAGSIEQKSPGTFRLKYVGNLTEGQQFRPLIEIVKKSLPDVDFRLICVGTRLTTEQRGMLDELMPGRYELRSFLPQAEAIREMADAEILLLLINYYEGSQGMLTTKLFEYIASKTPILCLGPKGGEAEELIMQYDAGACFDAGEKQAAADYLRGLHALWQEGRGIKNEKDVSALSSQNQALILIELLEGLKRG